jgi:hypothetical protein
MWHALVVLSDSSVKPLVRVPHPEERAVRRVSKDEVFLLRHSGASVSERTRNPDTDAVLAFWIPG